MPVSQCAPIKKSVHTFDVIGFLTICLCRFWHCPQYWITRIARSSVISHGCINSRHVFSCLRLRLHSSICQPSDHAQVALETCYLVPQCWPLQMTLAVTHMGVRFGTDDSIAACVASLLIFTCLSLLMWVCEDMVHFLHSTPACFVVLQYTFSNSSDV